MFRLLFGDSEKDRIKDPLAGFWSEGKPGLFGKGRGVLNKLLERKAGLGEQQSYAAVRER